MYNVFTYTKSNMAEAQAAFALFKTERRQFNLKLGAIMAFATAVILLFIPNVDNFIALAMASLGLLLLSEPRYWKNSIPERAKKQLEGTFEQKFGYGDTTIETYFDDNVRLVQNGKTTTYEWADLMVFLETARLLVMVFDMKDGKTALVPVGKDDFEEGSYPELVSLILEKRPDLQKRADKNAKEAKARARGTGLTGFLNRFKKEQPVETPVEEQKSKNRKERADLYETEEDLAELDTEADEAAEVEETAEETED